MLYFQNYKFHFIWNRYCGMYFIVKKDCRQSLWLCWQFFLCTLSAGTALDCSLRLVRFP